jgi:F5/8 type C domain
MASLCAGPLQKGSSVIRTNEKRRGRWTAISVVPILAASIGVSLVAAPAAAADPPIVLGFTQNQQTVTVPAGMHYAAIDAIGGGGLGTSGGAGARVTTTLAVSPGQTLKVAVGQSGREFQDDHGDHVYGGWSAIPVKPPTGGPPTMTDFAGGAGQLIDAYQPGGNVTSGPRDASTASGPGGGATVVTVDDQLAVVAGGGGGPGGRGDSALVTPGGNGFAPDTDGGDGGRRPGDTDPQDAPNFGAGQGGENSATVGAANIASADDGGGGGGGGGYPKGGTAGGTQESFGAGGGGGAGSSFVEPSLAPAAVTHIASAGDGYRGANGRAEISFSAASPLPGSPLAITAPFILASSSLDGGDWDRNNLRDGRFYSVPGDKGYSSDVGAVGQQIIISMGQTINGLVLAPRTAVPGEDPTITGAGFPAGFTISYTTDWLTWTDVAAYSNQNADDGRPRIYGFPGPVYASGVRITVTQAGRAASDDIGTRFQLSEMQFLTPNRLNATVTDYTSSSLEWGPWSKQFLVDGQLGSTTDRRGYTSDLGAAGQFAAFNLIQPHTINSVLLAPRTAVAGEAGGTTGAGYPSAFSVWVNTTGGYDAWTKVYSATGQSADNGAPRVYNFTPVQAFYVKIVDDTPGRIAPDDVNTRFQLSEVQFFGS